MKYKSFSIKNVVLVSIMTAIMCVIAPISVLTPFSIVPVSLSTLIIYLNLVLLGGFHGTISTILYILLGFCGLPVFSGFTGGVGKVLGPTGGYIIGYVFLSLIAGLFIDKDNNEVFAILGMILGTIALYIIGTLWLKYQTNMTFLEALFAGVIPFVVGDLIKIFIAFYLGNKIKNMLSKNNLL